MIGSNPGRLLRNGGSESPPSPGWWNAIRWPPCATTRRIADGTASRPEGAVRDAVKSAKLWTSCRIVGGVSRTPSMWSFWLISCSPLMCLCVGGMHTSITFDACGFRFFICDSDWLCLDTSTHTYCISRLLGHSTVPYLPLPERPVRAHLIFSTCYPHHIDSTSCQRNTVHEHFLPAPFVCVLALPCRCSRVPQLVSLFLDYSYSLTDRIAAPRTPRSSCTVCWVIL